MGIFTSPKRRAEQASQTRLAQAQANANRLRIFLPTTAAGLDSEGYLYAQRAIGVLVAIAGWPSLETFVYLLGSFECDLAKITNENEGRRLDCATAAAPMRLLVKAYAEPVTLADVEDMQTVACLLMVWWGFSDLAEPQHPSVRLMQHFGGHPFKADGVQAIEQRFGQIRSRITPAAQEVWKQAERELSTYSTGLPAT